MESTNSQQKKSHWFELLVLASLLGLLVWSARRPPVPPIEGGMPLPEMMAEGWLNTEEPLSRGPVSRERLLGKIVVVDFWFLGCPPCRAAMPELAKLYEKYAPLGVEFVGLTTDTSANLESVQQFIASVPGFDWPVGYGSYPTHEMLGISSYPTLIVFGVDGTAIWSSNYLDELAEVLDEALMRESRGL